MNWVGWEQTYILLRAIKEETFKVKEGEKNRDREIEETKG